MSALVMGLVWELPETPEFGRPEKLVLLAYADHADSNGKSIYPSVDLICKKTFYEERSVQKITRTLETLGMLMADGVGPHGTNRWAIPIKRTADGGAKIAPVQNAGAENAPEGNAPEGNAPEGNAPEPSVVVVINQIDKRFAEIARRLALLTGGALNTTSADLIATWIEKHSDEWISRAIEIADGKGARSANYVDTVLINWEAKGYPKSREEKVQGAKNGNNGTGNHKGTGPKKPRRDDSYSEADLAAANLINQSVGVP
jgi:DnaD/phage-associated family protein